MFRKSGVANFTAIIKIAIIMIKTTSKDSMKVKRIRKNVLSYNFYMYFQSNKN